MIRSILLLFCLLCTYTNYAQIGFSANTVVPPYNLGFRYGSNLGNYPPWSNQELADISAGNPDINIEGIGVQAFRPALQEHFLEQWGYDIRKDDFIYWKNRGIRDNVAFIGYPSAAHRDETVYCGTEQSELFKNMYEPIWDNGANGTPVNDDNYYASYVFKMVWEYSQFVKFWEVWNEPDLSPAAAAWLPPSDPTSWWATNPSPCDLDIHAPIQHYVRLLRITYEVIKFVDEDAYVCIGGIGFPSFLDAVLRNTDNPTDGSVTNDYPLTGGAYFDVLSFHSYPHIDGSMWEFPSTGGLQFHRHSDRGIDGFVSKLNDMRTVLENRGYDGTTYPKKLSICTETMMPRKQFNNYIGSEEAQINYLIKSLVESQRQGLLQTDLFTVSELSNEANAWNEYLLMGLFKNLEEYDAPDYDLTNAGIAFNTMTTLLSGKPYANIRTSQLNLPDNVRGAAFVEGDGTHTYVLWAKTETDQSEIANASYSFPVNFGYDEVTFWRWDYRMTGNAEVVSSQNIPLTGTPIFIKAGTHIDAPPVPNFSVIPSEGCAPLIVQFNDLSVGNPTSWFWEFPGANQISSNLQNPEIVYGEPGVFEVILTVENAFGENTLSISDFVKVEDVPEANFSFDTDDYTTDFSNNSIGATNFEWDFGDNSALSTEENPTHIYSENGIYTVTLTVTNDCGTHTFTEQVEIDVVIDSVSDIRGISKFEIFPNPNDGIFKVILEGESIANLEMSLVNLLGQKVFSEIINLNSGSHYQTFDGSSNSKGMYWLVLDSNGKKLRKKVIIN